jgi:hypothetical protein
MGSIDQFINNYNNDMNLIFKKFEKERLNNINIPFYDGGLTPIIIYYTNKYNLPIELNEKISKIKGDTLFQICNNFYKDYTIKPDLTSNNIDLFQTLYLKKYYFEVSFYNFDEVMLQFKNLKTENSKNLNGVYEWVEELFFILLGLLALKENFKLGLENKNQLEKYEIYINEITNDFLNNYPKKDKIEYLKIFWIFQLLNSTVPALSIKNQAYDVIMNLLKKIKPNKLLILNKEDSDILNYINNWIIYGLIRDYLNIESNKNNLYKKAKLESFENIIMEGFENEKVKNEKVKNEKVKNEKVKNEKKVDKSYFRFILYCSIFTLILLFGIRIIIFIWPYLIQFIKNIFYK